MIPLFFTLFFLTLAPSIECGQTIRRFEPVGVSMHQAAWYVIWAGAFDSVLQTWSAYEQANSRANDEATKTCPAQHKTPETPTPHDFLKSMISPLNVLRKFGDAITIPFPFFETQKICLGQRICRFVYRNPALTAALCVHGTTIIFTHKFGANLNLKRNQHKQNVQPSTKAHKQSPRSWVTLLPP